MYVWAMRDKRSEWTAVRSLVTSGIAPFSVLGESVCEPFVSVRGSRVHTPEEVIGKLAGNIVSVSASIRVFVDLENFRLVNSDRDTARMLTALSKGLGLVARSVVPVLRTTSGPEVTEAALIWARSNGTSVCMRVVGLTRLDQASIAVQSLIDRAGLSPSQIDLVTDAQDLPRIVSHSEIRSAFPITTAARSWSHLAGSFPGAITHLEADEYEHTLERAEWTVWLDEIGNTEVGRAPDFGDYATQCARYTLSPAFGGSPTVRYSTGESFMVLRGRGGSPGKPTDFSQYVGHARFLKRSPYFRSQVDTLGDDYIDRIANGLHNTGSLETWRLASLQRHVTLAASQVKAQRLILSQRNAGVNVSRLVPQVPALP